MTKDRGSFFLGLFCVIIQKSKAGIIMNDAVMIETLAPHDAETIAGWCADKDEDFLRQWAGMGYTYPLDAQQIRARQADGAQIFGAYAAGELIATIELISFDGQEKSALVGRFVVNPERANRGFGTAVMTAFLEHCRASFGAEKAWLYVFDFNAGAHRCYLKCGFAETGREERPGGWVAIRMEKSLG